MIWDHQPSHLDETFVVLEPGPVLDTSEVTIEVVVQDRRNFGRPDLRVVQVSTSSSSWFSSSKFVGELTL